MPSDDFNLDDSNLIRFCRSGHLTCRKPTFAAFLVRRGYEDGLSFNCMEMASNPAWDLVNGRPNAINEVEKTTPLTTTEDDLWAVSHSTTVKSAIRDAARKAAQKLRVDYSDVFPKISDRSHSGNPSHVGVTWNDHVISVPRNILDQVIATELAKRVESVFEAQSNRNR